MARLLTPDTWEGAATRYLEILRGQRLSPATIAAYRGWLLGTRVRRARGDLPFPDTLCADVLVALQLQLDEDGRAPGTALQATRTLKSFARFCVEQGWAASSSMLGLRNPRTPKHLPEPFADAEIALLLEAASYPRDRMLVRFLLGTGLRCAECAQICVDDLMETDSGGMVRVRRGKGAKERYAPLGLPGEPLMGPLGDYIAWVRSVDPDDPERHLWLTLREDGGRPVPLAEAGIYRAITRLGQAAGIHAHPHRFRHTWATRAVAA